MQATRQDCGAVARRNRRTALIVGSVALTFFVGFLAKMWMLQ